MVILLTACINPNGMIDTALNDKHIRKQQYIQAILWYLENTDYKIVFCENSLESIADFPRSSRIEYLQFNGNKAKDKGKAMGELEIITYAIVKSQFIKNDPDNFIIKITGRCIIENLLELKFDKKVFNGDFFPISQTLELVTVVFGAPIDFYRLFVNSDLHLNESTGIVFEDGIAHTIRKHKYPIKQLSKSTKILGICATVNRPYSEVFEERFNKQRRLEQIICLGDIPNIFDYNKQQ